MIEQIANWIIHIISTLGYPGIILTMTIESALIPLPSEVIMPFSGFLASTGEFNIYLVALAGAVGNVLGSLIAYGIGFYSSERIVRRFIRRYGKWILVSEEEYENTERLLHKHKNWVVLLGRMVPGVRTVVSLPGGIAKLPFGRFVMLTFLGSLLWSYFLALIGYTLGENWKELGPIFRKADIFVVAALIVLVVVFVYKKLKPTIVT